jgi:hypothetical protein
MVIHLGEADERLSITTHFIKRWKERIDPSATGELIRECVDLIIKVGNKYPIDELHYRMCYGGVCVVLMRLSPLHSLAKTAYMRDEESLSAI